MSGSEAVVESHYSDMKTKSIVGGQLNDILVQRANVDWSFQKTLAVPGNNQRRGNKGVGLLRHQLPVFIVQRSRALNKYAHGSKVLDRLAARKDHFVLIMQRTETQSDLTIKPHFVHIICKVYHNLAL